MATHCSVLAGKSHGQRSVMGYSPRDCRESDMTERLSTRAHTHTHTHTHTHLTTTDVRVADDGLFDGRLFH